MSARQAPQARVVLVGASNLTRGIAVALETAARVWGRPLDVLAALGHGRSYGITSQVLVRRLPGVLQSGLWPALFARERLPTAALLTDIGNDLLYEQPVERVAAWVDQCLARLADAQSRTVVTQLPIDNLADLSAARFEFFRRLFMPRCRLSQAELSARAVALSEQVAALASRYGAACVVQPRHWYGLDPLHFPLARRAEVWREILSRWREPARLPERARGGALQTLRLRRIAPELRWLCGRERRAPQPGAALRDGTIVSFY